MLYSPGLQPLSLSRTWGGWSQLLKFAWEKQLGIRSSVTYPSLVFLFLSYSCRGRGSQEWCLWEGVFPQNPSQLHSTSTSCLVGLALVSLGLQPSHWDPPKIPCFVRTFHLSQPCWGRALTSVGKPSWEWGKLVHLGANWQPLGVEKMGGRLLSDCGLGSEMFVSG